VLRGGRQIADVLPLPCSVAMVGYGALYGVLVGALLSLLGTVRAAVFGLLLGRRGAGMARLLGWR